MKSIIKFLSEARTELLKVSWPTRNVALSLTVTVLVVSVAFAFYIAAVDYGMTQGIKWITTHSHKGQASSGSNNIQATTSDGQPVNIGDIKTEPVK